MKRKKTRSIHVGNVEIGGDAPIRVQSMTNTNTGDSGATIAQIHELEKAGCEIIRVAVPDMEAANMLSTIKSSIKIPLIADIHFDYKLALKAIESNVDGLRINPGNIGSRDKIIKVVDAAKAHNIPIRIGINAGSLEKEFKHKSGHVSANAMVKSALKHIAILEELDFYDIKISLKSSDIGTTVKAYRKLSKLKDYPLHLGITESGGLISGIVKSSLGIGSLLIEGIGDTIRISLTASPVYEVKVAWEILKSLGIRLRGPQIVSCPTCGRLQIDLINLVQKVEEAIIDIEKPLKIALMGCVVNGPGEARFADVGIVGGKKEGVLYIKGKPVRKYPENELLKIIVAAIRSIAQDVPSC
ncbi:MAG: 4-hydroxy-3-methylbut-2-en-1-yl diphosphate synthase [Candidatus Schekmanbacteria bacterium RBG_13_48_7]|uniref:4-hydroxy-3-methylbut-2-en-1-yl diphosphate synthase (flavodoxin) n=1 Tax=Candidatus Schekmanbacteria bacterium RBG_13_48_7 TaxID=1817878 RepID=A0A1F7RUJ9_9BACT|nr:MAG: 4-hydroxy-3-methylbut-2-en-1-yl diphosphate synthase [Candidatus Schekmanbacteria bacterium RBG_13_48_7]